MEQHKINIEKLETIINNHKEEIKDKKKEYYQLNKEEIKKTKKEHYQLNKEEINEKKREKISCECGSTITKSGLSSHKLTKKHLKYIEN